MIASGLLRWIDADGPPWLPAGLAVGSFLGWGAFLGLGSFLVGGVGSGPTTYAVVLVALLATALAAAWAPARRASRLDPATALRTD